MVSCGKLKYKKSKQLNHFHLHILVVLCFKSVNKYFPAFLTFLVGLFLIKGITTKPKISHHCIIDIEQVEYSEDNYQDWK